MKTPRVLREQIKVYEAHGFHVVEIEPRSGAHFKAVFAEFSEPQILTKNMIDPHGLKNNLARFKRLSATKAREGRDR